MTKEELLAIPIGIPNVLGGYVHFYETQLHRKLSEAVRRINECSEILDKITKEHPDLILRCSPAYDSDAEFESSVTRFKSRVRFSVPIKGD